MDAVSSGEDSRRRRATSSRGMNVPPTTRESVGGLMPSWGGRWEGERGECGVGNSSETRGVSGVGRAPRRCLIFFANVMAAY